MEDRKARRRGVCVCQVGIYDLVRHERQELPQGLLRVREPLLHGLQAPLQVLRLGMLAVYAQGALGVGMQIVDEPRRLFSAAEDGARLD